MTSYAIDDYELDLERPLDVTAAETAVTRILRCIGEDPTRDDVAHAAIGVSRSRYGMDQEPTELPS